VSKISRSLAAFAVLAIAAIPASLSAAPFPNTPPGNNIPGPYTSIDGVAGSFTITIADATHFSVSFAGNAVSKLNGTLIDASPTNWIPASLGTFTFNRAPAGGPYANTNTTNPALQVQPTVAQGGGLATFNALANAINQATAVNNPGNNSLIIDQAILLSGNTTQGDFGPFGNPPFAHLTITLNSNQDIANFIATGAIGATLSGSGSFSVQAAAPVTTTTGGVPEPGSFAIAGLMIGLLGGYRLLRRRSEQTAASVA